jgi:hypothetical protein
MEEIVMSLLTESMEKCVFLDKKRVPDGEGGYIVKWEEGAEFQASIVFDTSMEARTAEKAGVTSLYTVSTPRNTVLEYHDVFKRISDNKVFRVTSDGDDKHTPNRATFQISQVTAEEYTPEAVTT